MRWYTFPENAMGRTTPDFRLPSSLGRPVSLSDYRGRSNLVLFFVHGADCAACQSAMQDFADRRPDYRTQTAEVLVIGPGPVDAALVSYPPELLVLADPEGETRRRYAALLPAASPEDVLVFVLDRYMAPYAALACSEADDPALQREVLDWLAFIEIQCPE